MIPSFRLLPMMAALPFLAACQEIRTPPVDPATLGPAPIVTLPPPPEPSSDLVAPESIETLSLDGASASASPAPGPAPGAVTANNAQETQNVPAAVLAALPPGAPSSVVFQNGDGCYLFSVERTEPLSGYPVRNDAGQPLCELDDGTIGPKPAAAG